MDIVKLILICWVFSSQASFLAELLPDKKIFIIPKYIMGCPKCFGFWLSLAISQTLWIAALCAFVLYLWDKIENKFFSSIEL